MLNAILQHIHAALSELSGGLKPENSPKIPQGIGSWGAAVWDQPQGGGIAGSVSAGGQPRRAGRAGPQEFGCNVRSQGLGYI